MKSGKALLLVIALLGAQSVPALAQSYRGNTQQRLTGATPGSHRVAWVRLRTPVFAQRMSEWCWVATISNAWTAQGHYVDQARLVAAVWGRIADLPSGAPSNITRLLDSKFVTDDRGHEFSSTVTGLYDSIAGDLSISNSDIIDSLARDVPVVMGTKAHAMLVVGMEFDDGPAGPIVSRVEVFDPWPGKGFRFLSLDEMTPRELGGSFIYAAVIRVD